MQRAILPLPSMIMPTTDQEHGIRTERLSLSPPPREVLSVAEIAVYFGVSESTVRKLIRGKKIPYTRIEGRYLFFLPVIRRWLEQNTQQTDAGNDYADNDRVKDTALEIWKNIQGEK
jgi:excisionase family DNA binding protein